LSSDQSDSYTIHICTESEIERVMSFINEYWARNHILSYHKDLVKWQYYNDKEKRYNIVLARRKDSPEILGILGYIPLGRFDDMLSPNRHLWLSLWKVRDDAGIPGLGLYILNFLKDFERPASIGVVGINTTVAMLYKALGYVVGKLNHFYMVNEKKDKFALIGGFNGCYCLEAYDDDKKSFIKVDDTNFKNITVNLKYVQPDYSIPQKSVAYLNNRFYKHPFYEYFLYAISNGTRYTGIIVIRQVEHENHTALRIVDYLGNPNELTGMKKQFQQLLDYYNAEYIDIYNCGIDDEDLAGAGFIKLDHASEVIIPNYYEPFEKRNVDIHYAYKADGKFEYMIFKGDGDQDRPNIISQGENK